jgi:hypothetical protein
MGAQRMGSGRANALKEGRELAVSVEVSCRAPAEMVYDVLSDVRTHLVWGGEQQSEKTRLLSMEAPEGPAVVGTEFRSEGVDPMGRFTDASVVTEATRPRIFEFVTEAHLRTKKGEVVDWTNISRYELVPQAEGSRIAYTFRVERISRLPGMLAMFKIPVVSAIARKAVEGFARRGVRNLARLAEQRSGG